MKGEYNMTKLFRLISGQLMIGEVINSDAESVEIKNPMQIDHKYNEQQMVQFRYIPWQILSKEETVTISKTNVVYETEPKTDLLDAYQQICISFIPLEKEDE